MRKYDFTLELGRGPPFVRLVLLMLFEGRSVFIGFVHVEPVRVVWVLEEVKAQGPGLSPSVHRLFLVPL
jgi:hypothetical protein